MPKYLFVILPWIYILTSCNSSSSSTNSSSNSNTKKLSVETTDFKTLVQDWDKAHNSKDIAAFSALYDNSVLFYGTNLGKNDCIENKLSLFKKYPDFYEQIYGDIQIENPNDCLVKCNFIKRVTVNQQTKDYAAYLTFKKLGADWKIVTEGDLTTDNNLSKKTIQTQNTKSAKIFVTGLNSAKVYTKEQAENGSEFNYKDGRSFNIKFFFNQVDVAFYAYNENNQKTEIGTKFEVGYYTPDGEWYGLKDSIMYLVGQYDFDADDIDELVIALQDNDEDGNGICLNIFKLKNDSWNQLGVLTGKMILGEPMADIKMNKVTIQRNLRGFYYQYILESGKFKDISNI